MRFSSGLGSCGLGEVGDNCGGGGDGSGGEGGGADGDGGGGPGGGGLGALTSIDSREITRTTVMFRRVLAASGVAKLLLSACITGADVAPASRVITAVMRTLAASTVISTASELTPVTLAMELCRLEVSE